MSIQKIDIGTSPNDGTGDTLRAAMDKVNDNLDCTQAPAAPISITASTWEEVTFTTAFADANYQLTLSAYDDDGNEVGIRRRNKTAAGFEVRAAVGCTLEYIAYKV